MSIIKKVIKNIVWFIFMLSVFALFFNLAYITGKGIFTCLAIIAAILATGIYRPIMQFIKDIRNHLA